MLLFFGYVENYTWFALALGLYLWAALSFLSGGAPLWLGSLALALAIGLNISGVVLLPSLVVLAAWGLSRRQSRPGVARDLFVTAMLFLGLQQLLASLGGGYSTSGGLRYMWDLVARGEGGERGVAYLVSGAHARDFLNIHLLIGPFAGLLLVPVALAWIFGQRLLDSRRVFLLVSAVPPLAVSWMFGDPLQGFPRDWDLFSPFALIYTAAAIGCITAAPISATTVNRALSVALVVSVFHTSSWVAINTSFDRSFERYKTLPISRGRTQFVVGYWYMTHARTKEAREWFERSVVAYPENNAAQYFLGQFAMDEGRYDEAVRRFEIATQVRPDKTNYRLGLADALVLDGRLADALPHLEQIIEAEPGRADVWGRYGIVLSRVGRSSEAHMALERAVTLAPDDPRFAKLLADVDRSSPEKPVQNRPRSSADTSLVRPPTK